MDPQQEILSLLNGELARLRSRNSSYSLRAYSKKLMIPVSALSEIMREKYPVTRKMAEKILQSFPIDPAVKETILARLKNKSAPKTKPQVIDFSARYQQLDSDHFRLLSEWFYFAILSLAETKDFQDDPIWIGRRLNISKQTAALALETLERLNLMIRDRKGNLVPTGKQFRTTSGIADRTIRNNHLQTVNLAKASIEQDPLAQCNFSSVTMATCPKKIAEAAEMIAQFRRQLSEFMESGEKTEVYRIAVQLFPLSRSVDDIIDVPVENERFG